MHNLEQHETKKRGAVTQAAPPFYQQRKEECVNALQSTSLLNYNNLEPQY